MDFRDVNENSDWGNLGWLHDWPKWPGSFMGLWLYCLLPWVQLATLLVKKGRQHKEILSLWCGISIGQEEIWGPDCAWAMHWVLRECTLFTQSSPFPLCAFWDPYDNQEAGKEEACKLWLVLLIVFDLMWNRQVPAADGMCGLEMPAP